jgi:hypothetical protein
VLSLAAGPEEGAGPALWVGTAGGVAAVDAGGAAAPREARALRIERVFAGGEEVDLAGRGELPEGVHSVAFEYALLSFTRPEATRYRTQLAGLEKRPSEWSAEGRCEFDGLTPGAYEFRVWARDWAGLESGPERRSFRVVAPRGRAWWTSALFAGAAAGLAYGAMRYGTRPKREEEPPAEEGKN